MVSYRNELYLNYKLNHFIKITGIINHVFKSKNPYLDLSLMKSALNLRAP